MGMTRQGVRRVTNLLNDDNLIHFVQNPDHATAPKIALTEKGKQALLEINSRQAKWANEIARHLPKRDLAGACLFFKHFQAALEKSESVVHRVSQGKSRFDRSFPSPKTGHGQGGPPRSSRRRD